MCRRSRTDTEPFQCNEIRATGAILFTAVQMEQNQQATGSALQAEVCQELKRNYLKPGNLLLRLDLFSVQTNLKTDLQISLFYICMKLI